jgi:purine-binding chemotaxis protein CheW
MSQHPDLEVSTIQAVVFRLGEETFALPVALVREILDHTEPFHIPNAPTWLLGLTDVRGQSVPLVDLRQRLGLASAPTTLATRILVVDMASPNPRGGRLVLGLVVDRVLDVTSFSPTDIEDMPDIGVRWRSDYIQAVMRRDNSFVVLLEPAGVLAGEGDLASLASMNAAA